MGKQKETRPYEGDARELLKIADAIYDQGVYDGLAEGAKEAGNKETVTEFLARLLVEHREYKEGKKQPFNETAEKTRIAAYILAQACEWKGAEIARAFCDALTDANFHKERKALAPEINRLFNTDIAKEG